MARPPVTVFGPAPHLEISVERTSPDATEVHVHPGGQGYWIARMIDTLGGDPWLCSPVGGELGPMLRTAWRHLSDCGFIPVSQATPARVIDRTQDRDGEPWHRSAAHPLDRHAVDDLFTRTLGLAAECGICVISGTDGDGTVPARLFSRLARDLAALDVTIVADISGDELASLLDGSPPDVLKVSDEELCEDGYAATIDETALVSGARRIQERGVRTVVVTRAGSGVLMIDDDRVLQVTGPQLSPVNTRGAGDSLTAAIALRLAQGAPMADSIRLGVAAGALNATRHGLGSGERDAIETLSTKVLIEEFPT